jgi:hypothetical protein
MTTYYSKSTSGFYDSNIHTIMPSDKVEISQPYYDLLMKGQSEGKTISSNVSGEPILTAPAVSLESKIKQYDSALTTFIDSVAQSLKYTSVYTAISFRNDPNPKFAAEAEALFLWRSEVWTFVNNLLDEALSDLSDNPEHVLPTPEQVIAMLPPFVPPTVE